MTKTFFSFFKSAYLFSIPKCEIGGMTERNLSITFGDVGVSTRDLRHFLRHFNLVKSQNLARSIRNWEDPAFRARELVLQLRGEVLDWYNQEENLDTSLSLHDNLVIEKLKEKYIDVVSLIRTFDGLKQGDSESLTDFMSRCVCGAADAFEGISATEHLKQRIIWRFFDGLQDRNVGLAGKERNLMKTRNEFIGIQDVVEIARECSVRRNVKEKSSIGCHVISLNGNI